MEQGRPGSSANEGTVMGRRFAHRTDSVYRAVGPRLPTDGWRVPCRHRAGAAPTPAAPGGAVRRRRRRTLRVAAGATLLVLVAFVTPLGTGARTAAALDVGPGLAPWLLSAMSLGLAVALLPTGALADEVGRRRVLAAGLLVAGRRIGGVRSGGRTGRCSSPVGSSTGLGGGAVLACALGVIAHAFPPGPARGRATGVWGASVGAGIAVGGLVTAAVDRGRAGVARTCCWASPPPCWPSRPAACSSSHGPPSGAPRTLGRAAARQRPGLPAGRPRRGAQRCRRAPLALLGGALLLLAAFVVRESRAATPMIDLGAVPLAAVPRRDPRRADQRGRRHLARRTHPDRRAGRAGSQPAHGVRAGAAVRRQQRRRGPAGQPAARPLDRPAPARRGPARRRRRPAPAGGPERRVLAVGPGPRDARRRDLLRRPQRHGRPRGGRQRAARAGRDGQRRQQHRPLRRLRRRHQPGRRPAVRQRAGGQRRRRRRRLEHRRRRDRRAVGARCARHRRAAAAACAVRP